MKLKSIHLKNLLSYGDEKVEFNDDLNIFVGANGSGKPNEHHHICFETSLL